MSFLCLSVTFVLISIGYSGTKWTPFAVALPCLPFRKTSSIFLLRLTKLSYLSRKKARHPPKRNTIHQPVPLNGKYSKVARLGGLIWRIVGGLLYIRVDVYSQLLFSIIGCQFITCISSAFICLLQNTFFY